MNILILEDDKIRQSLFKRKFIGHILDIVETAPEAIKFLGEKEYQALFLDHDLGGKILVPSGPGTGYEVAKWLEEHPDRKPVEIYLHTYNPDGRDNMKRALPEAVVCPGIWV